MENYNLNTLEKKYNIISYYVQQNSSYGICKKDSTKFFYKISSKYNIDNELRGYKCAEKYFNTPKIQEIILMTNNNEALILNYADEVYDNHGLLCDILNDKSPLVGFEKIFDNLIGYYEKSLSQPVYGVASESIAYKKFINDRINNRFLPWYINNKKIGSIKVVIASKTYSVRKILKETYLFLKNYKCTNLILAHGDPGDMNFGIKPRIFDLETFGLNPISLEFATFFINLFVGGNYIFPKYQASKYISHNNVYNHYNKIDIYYNKEHGKIIFNKLKYNFNSKRKYAIRQTIRTFEKANIKPSNKEIISMLIFRCLTIIDINNFQTDDQSLIILLVCIFYRGLKEKNIFDYLESFVR